MTDPTHTERITAQGKALVRAIEALGIIERALVGLLQAAYKRRLRGIVEVAPSWVTEEILSTSERIGSDRTVLWFGRN